jgi:hypothetical protein
MLGRGLPRKTESAGILRSLRARLHSRRGQSLTEFALLAPVLIFLTVGVSDMGRAFYFKEAVTNTTRQAIRLAVLPQNHTTVGDYACASFGGHVLRSMPELPRVDAISDLINAAANESSDGSSPLLQNSNNPTKITLDWHCIGNLAVTNSTAGTHQDPADSQSDSIRAQIDYTFSLITPFIGNLVGGQNIHIRSDVRGRSEY